MAEWIDLTRTFSHGMPAFPGQKSPEMVQVTDISSHGYTIFQVTTNMHVGTHIDAPRHVIEGGKYLSDLSVDRFMGRGRILDARGLSKITSDLLNGTDLNKGDIVLVYTGFERHFDDPERYFGQYPEVTEDFAQALVDAKAKILGMDTASPDKGAPLIAHKTLLSREVLIVENLVNLESLLEVRNFDVIALPAKYHCAGGPVRVVAKVIL